MARAARARPVRGAPRGRDRAPVHGEVRQHDGRRRLHVRRVRGRAVRLADEVRLRVRVAQLHRPGQHGERRAADGHEPRDGADGGRLRALRRAPRARLRRRPRPERPALLHQLVRAGPRQALTLAIGLTLVLCAPVAAQDEPPAPPAPPRVLATGDSMMYVMQQPLARRLRARGHAVKVDGRFGTGLTKPWILDWADHARSQVEEFHPDVTLMFIGASDAWPIAGARCCGARWRALYGRRVRELIAIYGRTVWLTLPAPRDRGLAKVFRGVNRAIVDATRGRAEVLDLVPVFTPGFRF